MVVNRNISTKGPSTRVIFFQLCHLTWCHTIMHKQIMCAFTRMKCVYYCECDLLTHANPDLSFKRSWRVQHVSVTMVADWPTVSQIGTIHNSINTIKLASLIGFERGFTGAILVQLCCTTLLSDDKFFLILVMLTAFGDCST